MYRISLFQLEIDDGNLQRVAGSTRVYDTANPAQNSFDVVDIGELVESLEVEEGKFQIDSVALTVQGLSASYFNSYNDALAAPFVVLIEGEDLIWHGVVDPESAQYNARTKFTSIEALSWDYLFSLRNAPARSVFETEFAADYNNGFKMNLARYVGGYDALESIQPGDVLVYKGVLGEERSVVYNVAQGQNSATVDVEIMNLPEALYFTGKATVTKIATLVHQIVITDPLLVARLKSPEAQNREFRLVLQDDENKFAFKTLKFDNNDSGNVRVHFKEDEGKVAFTALATGFHSDLIGEVNATLWSQSVVETGEKVRVLGKDMYGATDGSRSLGVWGTYYGNYDAQAVIDGAFMLPDYGVLGYIWDGFTNEVTRWLDRGIELPDNPRDAFKLILNTSGWFLRLLPSLSDDLPVLSGEIIERSDVTESKYEPTGIDNVTEWGESSADRAPRAVVVRPNVEYRKPSEYQEEIVGYYFDGIDDADVQLLTTPRGDGVIEIEVAATPAYEGTIYWGDGPRKINDDRLREIAKTFYNFYKAFKRPASAEIAEHRSDLLGRYASNASIEGGRTLFVTRQSVSLRGRHTSVDGLIGEYTEAVSEAPVVVVRGETVVADEDDSGSADVSIDASASYDRRGERLTFEWRNAADQLVTDAPLLEQTLGVGSHSFTIKVTNESGKSTEKTVEIVVLAFEDVRDVGDIMGFRIEKERVEVGGTLYGELRLYPTELVDDVYTVTYRKKSGGELLPTDTATENAVWVTDHYRCRVALADKHVSNIEATVVFPDEIDLPTQSFVATYGTIPRAEFLSASAGVDGDGNVLVSVRGDVDTRTVDGIEVYVADTYEGLDSAIPTVLDNPANSEIVYNGLLPESGVYVRIRLITNVSGGYGETWEAFVSNMVTPSNPEFTSLKIQNAATLKDDGSGRLGLYDYAGVNFGSLVLNSIELTGEGTTIEGEVVALADNIILLNSDWEGAPSQNGGLEINRGTSPNAFLLWDEGLDRWGSLVDGEAFKPFALRDGTLQEDLNADQLDGYDASAFPRKAENATISGSWTFNPSKDEGFPTTTSRGDVQAVFQNGNQALEIGTRYTTNERKSWILARHSGTSGFGDYFSTLHIQPSLQENRYRGVVIGGDVSTESAAGLRVGRNAVFDDYVGSPGFVSQTTGWRIDADGSADFRGIYADELTVKSFISDTTLSLAASDYLTKSVAVLVEDFVIPTISDGPTTITVESHDGTSGQVFESGDLIRVRVINRSSGLEVGDAWGTVSNHVDNGDGTQTWTYTTVQHNGFFGQTIRAGSVLLDYGSEGQGIIERTVLDGAGAPYSQIKVWTGSNEQGVPDTWEVKVRLGNLDGISDTIGGTSVSGWGLYSNNAFLKGGIVATFGEVAGWQITQSFIEKNNVRLTENGAILNTTGAWLLANNGSGFLAHGDISWDTSGNVTIIGSVTITGGSGIGNLSDAGALASRDTVGTVHIEDGAITADKINVTDLYALGATIAGWDITDTHMTKNGVYVASNFTHTPAGQTDYVWFGSSPSGTKGLRFEKEGHFVQLYTSSVRTPTLYFHDGSNYRVVLGDMSHTWNNDQTTWTGYGIKVYSNAGQLIFGQKSSNEVFVKGEIQATSGTLGAVNIDSNGLNTVWNAASSRYLLQINNLGLNFFPGTGAAGSVRWYMDLQDGEGERVAMAMHYAGNDPYISLAPRYSGGVPFFPQTLYITGHINVESVTETSDLRSKKNIATISNALEKVRQLRGVSYEMKKGNDAGLGVIAQEVQKVFPELVKADKDGFLSVNYSGLVGVLIEAIKELDAR